MKIVGTLAVLLAQLSNCAGFFCPMASDPGPAPIAVRHGLVQDIVPLGRGEHLVTTMTHPTGMAMTRLRHGDEESVTATPPLFPYSMSPSIVVTADGKWWFSRYGIERSGAAVFFAVAGEVVTETRVNVPVRGDSAVWLPLPGSEPRGVLVSRLARAQTLQFDQITPAGVKSLGQVAWPGSGAERTLAEARWAAEALTDGRIAVVTIDHEDRAGIQLYVFGEVNTHTVLPCSFPIDHAVDAAVDASGALAVVGITSEGRVAATVARVDDVQSARCRVISVQNETAMTPPFGTPAVEATSEGFVAAWIRNDGTIRACMLRDRKGAPLVVDVGRASTSDLPLRRLLHVVGDHVVFTWNADGEIRERWIPADVAGYSVAVELIRLVCAALDRVASSRVPQDVSLVLRTPLAVTTAQASAAAPRGQRTAMVTAVTIAVR